MIGIRLKNGRIFIKEELFTFKVDEDGTVTPSDISFEILERGLDEGTDDSWEYLSEGEIQAIPGGVYQKVKAMSLGINRMLGR